MKHKKVVVFFLLGILSMSLIAGIAYAVSPYEQAKIVAEEKFPELLEMIIEPNNQHFDFPDKSQYSSVTLGEPLRNFRIDFDTFDPSKSIEEQVKQNLIYTFPVLVDGKATIDITVGTKKNGAWDIIDVGGNLNSIVEDISKKHGLSENRALRFNGTTLVLAKNGSNLVGYSPYSDVNVSLKRCDVVKESELLKALTKRHEEIKEQLKHLKKGEMGGAIVEPPIEFKQESISNRLLRFAKHYL